MRDILIFTVQNNRYAMDLEHIQRIIELPELTQLPNAHPAANEIMSYESQVTKVIDFRKLIALATCEEELRELFGRFRKEHKAWLDAVSESVINATAFEHEIDPHQCAMGRWIDGYSSYDEKVSIGLKTLGHEHKKLHSLAADALRLSESDNEAALFLLQSGLTESYNSVMASLESFTGMLNIVAASLQKMLIYQNATEHFALKVDSIVDIACIDETTLRNPETAYMKNGFFEIEGVIEVDGMLINVIKSISIPKTEVA